MGINLWVLSLQVICNLIGMQTFLTDPTPDIHPPLSFELNAVHSTKLLNALVVDVVLD